MEGSAPPKKDGAYSMGEYPSSLSPEPQTPDSPHLMVVHSALLPLEPKVSGCK